tara:strand:- start:44 stop:766 length:723 start_codon:yes stop_codon:yes gene_type:complete
MTIVPEHRIAELTPILGVEFSTVYVYAMLDLLSLRNQWRIYKGLFGQNRERFELMNRASPVVSGVIERSMFEAALLAIRRLTDKTTTKQGKQPVTVRAFPIHLKGEQQAEMKLLVSKAVLSAKFARNWSDKRIAHSEIAYRTGAIKLEPASRDKVDICIKHIAETLQWIAAKKMDIHFDTHPVSLLPDETDFLVNLYEGELALKERKARMIKLLDQGKLDEFEAIAPYPAWLAPPPIEHD